MELYHVLTKKVHTFVQSFQESDRFRVIQRYHEQDNDCVHNSQIYNGKVEINARKFMTTFLDKIVEKEFAS